MFVYRFIASFSRRRLNGVNNTNLTKFRSQFYVTEIFKIHQTKPKIREFLVLIEHYGDAMKFNVIEIVHLNFPFTLLFTIAAKHYRKWCSTGLEQVQRQIQFIRLNNQNMKFTWKRNLFEWNCRCQWQMNKYLFDIFECIKKIITRLRWKQAHLIIIPRATPINMRRPKPKNKKKLHCL